MLSLPSYFLYVPVALGGSNVVTTYYAQVLRYISKYGTATFGIM